MMKLVLFVLAFLTAAPHADTLEAMISHALAQNPSLKSIEAKVNANRQNMAIAQQFANPELHLAINDIQFDDPLDRSIEPMQYSAINFKQKIPYFGKRDAHEDVVRVEEKVLLYSLDDAKARLVSEIKQNAYTLWQLTRLYAITENYEKLSQQNMELYTAYTRTSKNSHMGIMSTELALSQLKIRKSNLDKAIRSALARLSYLASYAVESVELDLEMESMPDINKYESALQNNGALLAKSATVSRERAKERSAEMDSYIDPYVQAGYFYRESFNDYVSIAVGASLPIYGTESLKEERARKDTMMRSFEYADYKQRLTSELTHEYAKMKDAYTTHGIIADESLPQIEHMFELSSASIRSSGELLMYTGILKQKLELDSQQVNTVADYYKAKAKIGALTGEMK